MSRSTLWVAGWVLACLVWGGVPPGGTQPVSSNLERSAMRIQFARTGGFAGMPLSVLIDLDTLPAAESQRLRDLIDSAGFFALPAVMTTSVPGGDRFQYTLTIETPERRHTVEIHEAAAPPPLRPLLEWLTSAAQAR